jgi:DNA-binding NarL/FixJ family response regulator
MNTPGSIVLAISNRFVQEMVYGILGAGSDYQVSLARDGSQVLPLINTLRPEVVLLDVRFLKAVERSLAESREPPAALPHCVIYLGDQEAGYAPGPLTKVIKGVLCHQCGPPELRQCLHEIHAGRSYFRPHSHEDQHARPAAWPADLITKRESDILHLLSKGFTNDQIAQQLGISYRTVVNHKHNVVEKLSLRGAHELLPFLLASGRYNAW